MNLVEFHKNYNDAICKDLLDPTEINSIELKKMKLELNRIIEDPILNKEYNEIVLEDSKKIEEELNNILIRVMGGH